MRKVCPDCSTELERYYIGDVIEEQYHTEEGWRCPKGHYYLLDFPVGCWAIPILITIIIIVIKLVT